MTPKPSIESNLFLKSLPKEDRSRVKYNPKSRQFILINNEVTPSDLTTISHVNYAWGLWLASVRIADDRGFQYRNAKMMKS